MSILSLPEFADKLNEVIPAIMKEFARRQVNELFEGKVTLPQFLLLEYLNAHGEAKMKDLAGVMQVTTAAMTGITDRLVKGGYTVRVFDPADRRIIRLALTPRGTALVKKVRLQRREMAIRIFGRLPEADRRDYLRILTQIRDEVVKQHSS